MKARKTVNLKIQRSGVLILSTDSTSLNLVGTPTEFSMSENHVFHIRISMILVLFETWATTIRAPTTSRCQNESFAWGDGGGKWPKLWQRYHGPCTKTAWKLASQVHLCMISLVAMVPSGSISTHTRLAAHLRFACYSFSSLIADMSEQEPSNYSVICNQKNSDLTFILIM